MDSILNLDIKNKENQIFFYCYCDFDIHICISIFVRILVEPKNYVLLHQDEGLVTKRYTGPIKIDIYTRKGP